MKIALLGYGKMGKEIEQIALSRGHEIALVVDVNTTSLLTVENLQKADVAIDFSTPQSAFPNSMMCFDARTPLVCGTTGWLNKMEELHAVCKTKKGTFFYASNFSVGVNLFFKLNKILAKMMAGTTDYQAKLTETHHIHKLDAPSGTAITLAEGIIENNPAITGWALEPDQKPNALPITAIREDEVPGIHTITYQSDVDFIEITHSAYNRKGFALGAVLAAEFIKDKKGIFGMNDMLSL